MSQEESWAVLEFKEIFRCIEVFIYLFIYLFIYFRFTFVVD